MSLFEFPILRIIMINTFYSKLNLSFFFYFIKRIILVQKCPNSQNLLLAVVLSILVSQFLFPRKSEKIFQEMRALPLGASLVSPTTTTTTTTSINPPLTTFKKSSRVSNFPKSGITYLHISSSVGSLVLILELVEFLYFILFCFIFWLVLCTFLDF